MKSVTAHAQSIIQTDAEKKSCKQNKRDQLSWQQHGCTQQSN